MFQTSYKGIEPLQRNIHYMGGFCRFWYIPVEDADVFPRINSTTQYLTAEVSLKAGKAWYGPIVVPRDKIGYVEDFKTSKAGPYYQIKVEGTHVGESRESRVNLENMPYHRYLVVGKVRAGGHYHLIGTIKSPCQFAGIFKLGHGRAETAQTLISFTVEHISKAYVLPSFDSDTIGPADGGGEDENNPCVNKKEIIPFVNQPTINIPWTDTRLGKFGTFPVIDVYIQEDGEVPIRAMGGSIEADQPPPAFTELSVKLGGNPSGFIVIT